MCLNKVDASSDNESSPDDTEIETEQTEENDLDYELHLFDGHSKKSLPVFFYTCIHCNITLYIC